ncbi:ETX/MTX2 family pore-forming toxin [Bacillus thuringiensis]
MIGALTGALFTLTTTSQIYAQEVQSSKNSSDVKQYSELKKEFALQDIDSRLEKMVDSIPPVFHFPWEITDLLYGKSIEYLGSNINESNVTKVKPLYLGHNIFENTFPIEQTFNTASFSKAVTHTTSTETQFGFKSSITAGGKAGVPFVAEGEWSTTLEFNASHTNTNTTSETTEITAPSQSVRVPANKTYKVEVYFEQKSTSGEVELFADILTGVRSGRSVTSIGNALDKAKDTQGFIKSPIDPNKVRANGTGKFTIEYGTNLVVKTYDITSSKRSNHLVDTKIIPLN